MAGWLEQAAGPGGGRLDLVYLLIAVGLALVATVLHFRRRKGTPGELKAVRTYFAAWAVLLLGGPCAIIALTAARPLAAFASFGWTFGRVGLGLGLTLVGLPIAFRLGFLSSRDAAMRTMYPLARAAFADVPTFVRYELAYFFLYYLPWESVFRGVLLLPLVPAIGLVPALAVQTVLTTLLHFGHPGPEVRAAAGGGLALGLVAYFTGSFVYPLIIHAASGISLDIFSFVRERRTS
jgi:membrane protease YdiL (CAAX protease family)